MKKEVLINYQLSILYTFHVKEVLIKHSQESRGLCNMIQKPEDIATRLLGSSYDSLDERTKKVARHVAGRKHIARNTVKELDEKKTLGQRAADKVATFGGSWLFIGIFALIMLA
jgi:hypothetical protein